MFGWLGYNWIILIHPLLSIHGDQWTGPLAPFFKQWDLRSGFHETYDPGGIQYINLLLEIPRHVMKIGLWNRWILCSPKTFFAYLVLFDNPSAHKPGERDHSSWLQVRKPSKVLQRGDNLSRDLLEIPLFFWVETSWWNSIHWSSKSNMIGWVAYMGIILFFFSTGILNSPIFFFWGGGQFPPISHYITSINAMRSIGSQCLARHWTIPWRWQVDGSRESRGIFWGVQKMEMPWGQPAAPPLGTKWINGIYSEFYELGLIS